MAQGMLSSLFGVPGVDPEEAAREKRALELGQMDPFAAARATAYGGAAQAGRGLGQALGGAMGADTRSPTKRRTDAIEAVKAQVAQMGFDPEDPKSMDQFFRTVMQMLQKQGLAGEALEVAKEWQEQKVTALRAQTAAQESDRKAKSDAAKDARARERNEILRKNGIPEFAKYIQMIEDATDPATRQLYTDRVNQMLGKSGKGVKVVDLGDKVQLVDAATGAPIGAAMDKGAVPMNEKDAAKAKDKDLGQERAYKGAIANAQQTYDAAVALYNHPGLQYIVGRRGALITDPTESGEGPGIIARGVLASLPAEGRDAWAKYQQVIGKTFLQGLVTLKDASPQGSTGLGQLSNIEGKKVQSASAALDRSPDAPDFRANLKTYIDTVVDAVERLNAAAPAEGLTPIPLQLKPLTGGTPPAVGARPGQVKVQLPDGRTGYIPQEHLEAAKARGAKVLE